MNREQLTMSGEQLTMSRGQGAMSSRPLPVARRSYCLVQVKLEPSGLV
ncbi:MAG: hypothetical protein LBH43_05350 [Treponema sp.]|nr:hypothetical protein [Treponema sp.]